ncbi:MAG TPA: lasso RiPP family leader peptide-containing protein [Solirubrobacteraceae bacterium]|nr:lasso RiPP family leader peptide-containing protein [Solirubrobacteraceae bacterium]
MEKNTTTEYEAPRIEDHGDLTELTAGRHGGATLDATFPTGTPKGDLTFTTP